MKINVIKSNRKTISITIDEFGNVVVKAPTSYNNKKIESFIESKKIWINKHVGKKTEIISKYKQIISKEKALLFGKIIDYSEDYYKNINRVANQYLPLRLKYLAEKFFFIYSGIKIKNYTSRWGACDKHGFIYLNSKLVMLDEYVIDYVILHELCHTIHFNHKKNFHDMLSNYFKDEKQIVTKLKEFSFLLKITR